MKLILIVSSAIPDRGHGSFVLPRVEPHLDTREPFAVEIRAPGGTTTIARALYEFPHIRGPSVPLVTLRLPELAPDSLKPGTEIRICGSSDSSINDGAGS